jgi:hypothetical protein
VRAAAGADRAAVALERVAAAPRPAAEAIAPAATLDRAAALLVLAAVRIVLAAARVSVATSIAAAVRGRRRGVRRPYHDPRRRIVPVAVGSVAMEAAIALHSVICRVRANPQRVGTDQVAEISPAIDPIAAIGLIPVIGRVAGSSPAIGPTPASGPNPAIARTFRIAAAPDHGAAATLVRWPAERSPAARPLNSCETVPPEAAVAIARAAAIKPVVGISPAEEIALILVTVPVAAADRALAI